MMDWQGLVVALVVLAAAVYLVRRAYVGYSRPNCGDGCDGCPSKGQGGREPNELVQLRLPKRRKSQSKRS